jgi:hypothetical protein
MLPFVRNDASIPSIQSETWIEGPSICTVALLVAVLVPVRQKPDDGSYRWTGATFSNGCNRILNLALAFLPDRVDE